MTIIKYLKHFHIVIDRILPWNAVPLIRWNGLIGWMLGIKQPCKALYRGK